MKLMPSAEVRVWTAELSHLSIRKLNKKPDGLHPVFSGFHFESDDINLSS
jgi:hypothetical protein